MPGFAVSWAEVQPQPAKSSCALSCLPSSAAVLPLLFPGGLAYSRVFVLKAGYGALVALVITPLAISWVLKEYLSRV
jgi:hypothetical protein